MLIKEKALVSTFGLGIECRREAGREPTCRVGWAWRREHDEGLVGKCVVRSEAIKKTLSQNVSLKWHFSDF